MKDGQARYIAEDARDKARHVDEREWKHFLELWEHIHAIYRHLGVEAIKQPEHLILKPCSPHQTPPI